MAHRDYEELLACFNAHGVRYLVGGAHALAFHARPRATKDLDIFLDPTRANADRVVAAITEFFGGSAPSYVSPENLLDPEVLIQLGVAPVRIDLLTVLGSPGGFRAAWRRRADGRFGKVPAHYLSIDDLIADKTHWDRAQDRADVASLERAKSRAAKKRRTRAPRRSGTTKGR